MTSVFGKGDFGVGNFSAPTNILFSVSGNMDASADTIFRVWPMLHISSADDFSGDVLPKRTVLYKMAGVSTDYAASATLIIRPTLYVSGEDNFNSSAFILLDPGDDETLRLLDTQTEFTADVYPHFDKQWLGASGDTEFTGEARGVAWTPFGVSVEFGLEAGPQNFHVDQPYTLSSLAVTEFGGAYRAALWTRLGQLQAPIELFGSVRPSVTVPARLSGALELSGRASYRLLPMRLALDTTWTGMASSLRLTYSWSDLTAPGREPPSPWQSVSPDASDWSVIEAPASNWQQI